jgi:hypothetical protein
LYLLSSFGVNSIGIVAKVWGSWAPSKVIVFSWQALHARLPTRLNLSWRGVFNDGEAVSCVLCADSSETEDHFFASCPMTWVVWSNTSVVWYFFGIAVVHLLPIESFLTPYRKRNHGIKGVFLVWHGVTLVLWWAWNKRIFVGKVVQPQEIFDKVHYVS